MSKQQQQETSRMAEWQNTSENPGRDGDGGDRDDGEHVGEEPVDARVEVQ